jgi:amino-acid N-acetyltransferase
MIRGARLEDVPSIQRLIKHYSAQGLMLPRSLQELYENIRDFFVYEENGKVVGCCALHVMWKDLAEIRSLAVHKHHQREGVGSALLQEALKEARRLGIKRVFTLTYNPEFFEAYGFVKTKKQALPQKIWGDCVRCVHFPDCKEVPLMYTL